MMDIFKKFFALFLTSAVMFLYAFVWIITGFGSKKAASLYADAAGQQLTEEEKKWFRKNFLKHGVTSQSRK